MYEALKRNAGTYWTGEYTKCPYDFSSGTRTTSGFSNVREESVQETDSKRICKIKCIYNIQIYKNVYTMQKHIIENIENN